MKIDKNNYEAYFLDSIEGNLSASLQKELDLFLSQNPIIKAELEEFEMIELETENVSNDSLKAGLIREESTGLTEQDYLLISTVEGTITAEEKEKLNALILANPNLKKDLATYQKTQLANQERLVFPNKAALIRKQGKVIYFFRYAAAAAAAILAFVWFNNGSLKEQYIPRTAEKVVVELEGEDMLKFAKVVVLEKGVKTQESALEEAPIYEPLEQESNFAQVETPKRREEIEENPPMKLPKEVTAPVIEVPAAGFAKKATDSENPNKLPLIPSEDQMANLDKPSTNKEEFISLNEFAKNSILKNKTVSEVISEELAQISNDKINFETVKSKQGKVQQFALNIGKLSISRK